jgi:hypothetical protein
LGRTVAYDKNPNSSDRNYLISVVSILIEEVDIWLRRAKGSEVQRQKEMNRNRLGDDPGETNRWSGNEQRCLLVANPGL